MTLSNLFGLLYICTLLLKIAILDLINSLAFIYPLNTLIRDWQLILELLLQASHSNMWWVNYVKILLFYLTFSSGILVDFLELFFYLLIIFNNA